MVRGDVCMTRQSRRGVYAARERDPSSLPTKPRAHVDACPQRPLVAYYSHLYISLLLYGTCTHVGARLYLYGACTLHTGSLHLALIQDFRKMDTLLYPLPHATLIPCSRCGIHHATAPTSPVSFKRASSSRLRFATRRCEWMTSVTPTSSMRGVE